MNRLVILEDNLEFSRNLLNYIITRNKKVQLWSLAIDGKEIEGRINFLQENDILILDLGLPTVNGIKIIEKLLENEDNMPHIIVMSGDAQLLEEVKNYTPYLYTVMEKPFSFERLVDVLEQITFTGEQKHFQQMVKEELRKFDINITTMGYTYIADAITFALGNEEMLKNMQNMLYRTIGIKNNISQTNVKWTIEKCVKSIRRYTSTNIIRTYFHTEEGEKITPKFFIATIVENIKLKNDIPFSEEKEEIYF